MSHRQLILQGLLFLVALAAFWFHYRQWRHRRRVRGQMRERGQTPRKPPAQAGQWVGMAFGVVVIVLVFILQPRATAALGRGWGNVVVWGGVFVAAFAFFFAQAQFQRDRITEAAERRAKSGDVEGALAMLHAAMDEQPTARRAGVTGAVLGNAGRHAEAADAFARAEELDRNALTYPVMWATMLAKASRPGEALPHIEALREQWPQDGGLALAAAHLLAQLGRLDEAREQFRQGAELAEAFPHDQRVDLATSWSLSSELTKQLGPAGDRAFAIPARPDTPQA